MVASRLFSLAVSAISVTAQVYQGFNYGSVNTDNSPITQSEYENAFNTAKQLAGTSGFTSARIYTMIQAGTINAPTQAIPAAISTRTSLLLGLFLSSDQSAFDNELAALRSAISTYGQAFVDLIAGISVGSEDLYRISPIGIENHSNPGLGPAEVTKYISQVRALIANTAASSKPVGHVDTWTAWVNGSNDAVINAVDFLGTDAYPYYQNTMGNAIENGNSLFFDAYQATVGAASGKPVWVTETGWPVSGPQSNLAVASVANAKTYWDQVGCSLFGKTNTWWYTLQDAYPTTPSPSFGIVGTTLSTTPLYDLSCSGSSSSSSSAISQTSTTSSPPVASTTSTAKAVSPTSQTANSLTSDSPVTTRQAPSGPSNAGGGESISSATGGKPPYVASTSTTAPLAPSVRTMVTYTTGTTYPVTIASSFETKTFLTTSQIVLTSSVGSTLSSVTKSPTTSPQPPSPTENQSTRSCPATLSDLYQFPHLLVEVDKTQPSKALGNSYNAHISSNVSSIFNFDIPPSYQGKTCSLVFFFPQRNQLTTSNHTAYGDGGLDFTRLQSPATEQTTYNTIPAFAKDIGSVASLQAGNSYVIVSGPCYAGQRIAYQVSVIGNLDLDFFQDFGEPAIGLYITAC